MRLASVSWSLAGLGAPIVVAALTLPALIQGIGMDRFGLLALALGLIGFAGAFDLGIGRATTLTIARMRGTGQLGEARLALRIATSLSLRLGLASAAVIAMLVWAGATHAINYPIAMRGEVDAAAYLVALTVPVQALSATFRGVNEALERFREISMLRIGLGVANFLGPFVLAQYTTHLAALVGVLFVSRLLALYIYRRVAVRQLPPVSGAVAGGDAQAQAALRREMLAFGGWFTVSCVVSPLLSHVDRFVIGVLISAQAIAAYTIPMEVVAQALIVAGAVSSVAFPSLSRLMVADPVEANRVFRVWLLRLTALMFAITVVLALSLPTLLPLWIGEQLPAASVLVGQVLCLGVFANSIGSMYFARLHAHARADITAKLHLIELPIFLLALYLLIHEFGVTGAACAWSARMVLDALLLAWSQRQVARVAAVSAPSKS
jgi:O-antigen/teichoic acid export membrane protein